MKCPNCGSELESDVYNVFPRIVFCLYCESGDFSTEYTLPSLAVAEVESAYKWNEQRRKENDYGRSKILSSSDGLSKSVQAL